MNRDVESDYVLSYYIKGERSSANFLTNRLVYINGGVLFLGVSIVTVNVIYIVAHTSARAKFTPADTAAADEPVDGGAMPPPSPIQ